MCCDSQKCPFTLGSAVISRERESMPNDDIFDILQWNSNICGKMAIVEDPSDLHLFDKYCWN